MTYVCSDIHGYYGEYMDALGLLGKDDTLYIIGDVLDRGPDGIEILLDIMNRKNVVLLKGNHEYMLTDTLSELAGTSSNEAESIIESSLSFEPYGQGETLRAFAELDADMQYNIIDFINRLPYYAELEVGGQQYVLVHAGLPDFDDTPLDFYNEEDLLFGSHDYEIEHYEDTIVLIGHQPTRYIFAAEPDKIYYCNDTINLDCGLGRGGQLGVLCLDTGEEIYF